MSQKDWRRMRVGFFCGLLVSLVFGFIIYLEAELWRDILSAVLAILFFLGTILTGSCCYGYIHRDKIDATDAVVMETGYLSGIDWIDASVRFSGKWIGKLFGLFFDLLFGSK